MPDLKFSSFETDGSNKFAIALIKAIVQLEKGYSPLLIHGGSGCGKTHLLSVLNTELALAHPELSVLNIPEDFPIEKFPFENGSEAMNGAEDTFQYRAYSSKDLLIVDDIERFLDEPKSCERFYAIFDTFVDNAKQVVLSSSMPIEKMEGFSERFLSRLRGGIDAHLSPPKPESRLKILRSECGRLNLKLDVDVLQVLMSEAGKDVAYLKRLPGLLKMLATLDPQIVAKEKVEEILAFIRSETAGDKRTATAEQIYCSWVQTQAREHEATLNARIQELEQNLSAQIEIADGLNDELEILKSRDKSSEDQVSTFATQIQQLKKELKEKDTHLHSQETIISEEIANLTKDIEKRDRLIEKLRTDYEKSLSEKDARVLELERMFEESSEKFVSTATDRKEAEVKIRDLTAELEKLAKTKEDELLALKIQLEDKEEKLGLLREEREMRTAQYEKEITGFQEKSAELQNQNLLLERASDDVKEHLRELEGRTERKEAEIAEIVRSKNEVVQQRDALSKELEKIRSKMETKTEDYEDTVHKKTEREQELVSILRAREKELKTTRAEIGEQEAQWKSRIKSIEKQLRQREEMISKLESKLESEIDERKSLKNQLSSGTQMLEDFKQSSEAQRTELQGILSEKEQALADASELETQLRKKIDDLSNSLDKTDSELQSNKSLMNELSERISSMETELASTSAELQEALQQNHKHLEEARKISSERDALKDATNTLTSKLETLNGTVRKRDAALSKKDSELDALKASFKELQNTLLERDRLLTEVKEGEAEQVRNLQEELNQRSTEMKRLGSELVDTKLKLRENQEEIEKLNSKLTEASEEIAELSEAKTESEKDLSATIGQSAEELETVREQLAETQTKLAESKAQSSELGQELSRTRKELAKEIKDEKGRWIARERDLVESNTSLKADLGQAAKEIQNLKSAISELRGEIESREQILVAKEKDESQQISRLKDELKRRDSELQRLSQELEGRNKELDSNVRTITELNRKLPLLEADLSKIVKEKQSLEQQLSGAVEGAERRAKEKEKRLTEMQAELEKARSHTSGIQKQLDAERTSHEGKLGEASGQIIKLKEEAEKREQKLKEQEKVLKNAREEASKSAQLAEEKGHKIIDLQKEAHSLRQNLSKQATEGSETQGKVSSLQAELSEKEKALAAMQVEIAEFQENHEKLKIEAEEARKKLESLEFEKREGQQEVDSQRQKIERLELLLSGLPESETQPDKDLLSRISELERSVREKEKTIESWTVREKEQLEIAVSSKDDEIGRLKVKHEELTNSLKDQVKGATNELLKVRESADKRIKESRRETENLRARIAQLEAHIASIEAGEREILEPAVSGSAFTEDQINELESPDEAEVSEERAALSAEDFGQPCQIEWLHSLEDFEVSEANTFFMTMAEKIARNIGELYNPLCIYGPQHSGKTHILHAIGNFATSESPELSCQLISVPSLLDKMQNAPAIIDEWLDTVHLMIVDDFDISAVSSDLQLKLYQFLSGLAERQSQVVIAANEPPIRMENIQEHFLRFLESGLLAKLEVNPEILEKYKEAADAVAFVAQAAASRPEEKEVGVSGVEETGEGIEGDEQEAAMEVQKDFMMEFLSPDPQLISANFRGRRAFEEVEEAFKNPNQKRRDKFPLSVIEDDGTRRNHFFNAMANRLQEIFDGQVSLLSIDKLAETLAQNPSFDWKDLLNKCAKSKVVLINDCDSMGRLPEPALKYLKAIVEEISKRDILLMIGASKKYKKEPVFGTVYKKSSRKRI